MYCSVEFGYKLICGFELHFEKHVQSRWATVSNIIFQIVGGKGTSGDTNTSTEDATDTSNSCTTTTNSGELQI